jgi:hypothetical protein
LDFAEQVQDLGLHRCVERGDRLVGHQEAWFQGEGSGNRNSLLLAATQLFRAPTQDAFIQGNRPEQFPDSRPDPGIKTDALRLEGFGHDFPYGHPRVKGADRILEYHLEFAPLRPQPGRRQAAQITPVEQYGSGIRRLQQQGAPRQGSLPATGFPDQPDGISFPHYKIDPGQRPDGTTATEQPGLKINRKPANFEDGNHAEYQTTKPSELAKYFLMPRTALRVMVARVV